MQLIIYSGRDKKKVKWSKDRIFKSKKEIIKRLGINIKKIKKYLFSFLVGIVFGFILCIAYLIFIDTVDLKELVPTVQIFVFIFVPISALIAFNQFIQTIKKNKQDEQWNEKYQAYSKANEYVKELEIKRTLLDEIIVKNKMIKDSNGNYISFSDRLRTGTKLSPEEVHGWVCEKNTSDEVDIKKLDSDKDMCATSLHGAKVIRAILTIINTYEMIAIGIYEKILNKDMILEIMQKPIETNFEIMEDYIIHRRTKHENTTFAIKWEELYKEIKKAEK